MVGRLVIEVDVRFLANPRVADALSTLLRELGEAAKPSIAGLEG